MQTGISLFIFRKLLVDLEIGAARGRGEEEMGRRGV
jgi:hypothetical protein